MKKSRFSDHIMPRRIVRQFLWLCAESAVLYVIFKITAVIWRSILLGIPASRWILFFVMVVLMASFPALWKRFVCRVIRQCAAISCVLCPMAPMISVPICV